MSAWLRHWSRRGDVAARVLCVPPAGAGAHAYRSWAAHCPPHLGLVAVELPGHGSRLRERPESDMASLATGPLLSEVAGLLDRPLAVFGHSMGALIGLDLCGALRHSRGTGPVLLVAAASAAPEVEHPPENFASMTDAEVVRYLYENGGTSAELLDDEEYVALLAPVIRADFALVASRPPGPQPVVGCPVRSYLGASDATVSPADVTGWARHGNGDFAVHTFPGGHFFPQEDPPAVVDRLVADLDALLPSCAPTAIGSGMEVPVDVRRRILP